MFGSRPRPIPGFPLPTHVGSSVPTAAPRRGEPRFTPVFPTVSQFTPSVSPMLAHVRGMIDEELGPSPGYPSSCAAIVPAGASAAKPGDSYQPCPVVTVVLRKPSYAKKAKTLFFQKGPPMVPPNWLKRELSRFSPRSAALPAAKEPGPL